MVMSFTSSRNKENEIKNDQHIYRSSYIHNCVVIDSNIDEDLVQIFENENNYSTFETTESAI